MQSETTKILPVNPKKAFDIDLFVIMLIPFLIFIEMLVFDERTAFFAIGISLGIFLYEIIIFQKRSSYGLNAIKVISIPSLSFLTFTVFIAIPGIYVCSKYTNHTVVPYFISIFLFFVLYPIGIFLGDFLFKIDRDRLQKLNTMSFVAEKYDRVILEFLLSLLLIILVILAIYLLRTSTIPLFDLIRNPGEYVKLKILREQALKLLPVSALELYLFNWMRTLFVPTGIIASLFLLQTDRSNAKYKWLFWCFLISGMFINVMTLEKSPITAIFLAISAYYFLRLKKINLKFILMALSLIILAPVFITFFMYYDHPHLFRLIYISLLDRIFLVPSEVTFHYFDIFPRVHNFLYGRSSHMFSWILGNDVFDISNYVARVWWKNPLTSGFANSNYIGNFWADFGYSGIIFSTLGVGIFNQYIFHIVLKTSEYRKNIIYVTIICILSPIFTFGFFSSNFPSLLLTRGLLIIIICLLIFHWFNFRFIKNRSNLNTIVSKGAQ